MGLLYRRRTRPTRAERSNWVSRAEGLGLGVEVTVGDSGRVESSEEPRSVC